MSIQSNPSKSVPGAIASQKVLHLHSVNGSLGLSSITAIKPNRQETKLHEYFLFRQVINTDSSG